MKFLREHSYDVVKLILNQIGVTVFGTVMWTATAKNPTLLLLSGLLSIGLYLFLQYTLCWEVGAKDKIKIDGGRLAPMPAKGALLSLLANIPNLLLALLVGLGILINTEWGANMAVVCNAILRLLSGMYLGVISLISGALFESPKIEYEWWWFIVAVLPSIGASAVGYLLGSKNKRISAIFGISAPASGKNHK